MGISGLGFRVSGFGFRVSGSGSGAQGLGFIVYCFLFLVWGIKDLDVVWGMEDSGLAIGH